MCFRVKFLKIAKLSIAQVRYSISLNFPLAKFLLIQYI